MASSYAPILKRGFAELLGTGLLTFAIVTSILYGAPVIGTAITAAVILSIGVFVFGGRAFALFNPALSLGLMGNYHRFRQEQLVLTIQQVLMTPFQFLGAMGGVFLACGLVASAKNPVELANFAKIVPHPTGVVGGLIGFLIVALYEALGTALLGLAVSAATVDNQAPSETAPLHVGLALGAGIMLSASRSGGFLNPALVFGIVATLFVKHAIHWSWSGLCLGTLAFGVAPIVGVAVAAFIHMAVTSISPVPAPPAP